MRLRVWLPPLAELRHDTAMPFDILDARRRVRNRGEAVIGMLPKGIDCELVLDALDVGLLDVKLPKLSGTRLAKALPAMLEERLIGDVERIHVVATSRDAGGTAVAAVVDRALLKRALDIFARAARRVVQATPQPLALRMTPGGWSVRWRDGKGCVRTDVFAGMGFESTETPPLELRLLLSQSVVRPGVMEVDGDCDVEAWSEALGVAVRRVPVSDQAPPVALDLLQHEFSQSIVKWQEWRPTMLLGIVLLLTALGGLNVNAWKLRAEESALRKTMVDILKQSFPRVSVVLDPIAQMRQMTSNLRAGAGTERGEFLQVVVALGEIADADSIQAIEYRDGRFTMRFRSQDVETDAKRATLTNWAQGLNMVLRFDGNVAVLSPRLSQ